ncbi:MAG: S-layer homology domain-containing protein, partial [Clostridia bacterium]|nr:S-layer homology domain-containing protein [Clostridia bacterium]MBR3281540.1 S-layer homology domain-containing protein [Clostridia bacterium]
DDDAEMHSWGKDSIYYMSNIEIIKGMGDNKFGVLGNATREQSLLISVRSAEKFAK